MDWRQQCAHDWKSIPTAGPRTIGGDNSRTLARRSKAAFGRPGGRTFPIGRLLPRNLSVSRISIDRCFGNFDYAGAFEQCCGADHLAPLALRSRSPFFSMALPRWEGVAQPRREGRKQVRSRGRSRPHPHLARRLLATTWPRIGRSETLHPLVSSDPRRIATLAASWQHQRAVEEGPLWASVAFSTRCWERLHVPPVSSVHNERGARHGSFQAHPPFRRRAHPGHP